MKISNFLKENVDKRHQTEEKRKGKPIGFEFIKYFMKKNISFRLRISLYPFTGNRTRTLEHSRYIRYGGGPEYESISTRVQIRNGVRLKLNPKEYNISSFFAFTGFCGGWKLFAMGGRGSGVKGWWYMYEYFRV